MYPNKIEYDSGNKFFSEEAFFKGKFNYIHTYLHIDYKYRMHSHQFYEINMIAEGAGRHYIENNFLDTAVGDVFVIPPGVNHGYYSDGKLNIYHVLIKTEFFSRYAEELAQIDGFDILFDIEPQIRLTAGKAISLNAADYMTTSFKDTLEKMISVEKSGRYVYLNALTMAFICRLCERMCGAVSQSCEKDIVGVMEYIKNNLDAKITLGLLSDFAHMSPATLNRRFKAVTGRAPLDYVLSCRVAKAQKLIAEGNYGKTDVANICGFYDVSHMNKYL